MSHKLTNDFINRPSTIVLITSVGFVIAAVHLMFRHELAAQAELYITNAIASAMLSLGIGLFFALVLMRYLFDLGFKYLDKKKAKTITSQPKEKLTDDLSSRPSTMHTVVFIFSVVFIILAVIFNHIPKP